MSTRYDDRDDDRSRRNYGGRRSGQENDRSYGQSGQGRYFDDESERYSNESRWRGQSGGGQFSGGQYYGTGRNLYRGGESQSRQDWANEGGEDDRDYSSERNRTSGSSTRGYGGGGYGGRSGSEYGGGSGGRFSGGYGTSGGGYGSTRYGDEYGGSYGGGFESGQGRYRDTWSGSSRPGTNYPSDYSSGSRYGERGRAENYGERGRGYGDFGRGGYGDYGRGGPDQGEERGWWDRASDAVASWFGDEEAERRRRMDEQQRPYRGRGPKGYRRSDERIKEDVNDRLSEGYIDASEIEVNVQSGEVVLTGTVNSRYDKRRAEDIAENVSGVSNVENRLRVRQQSGTYGTSGAYGSSEGAGTSTMGTSGLGTTDTGTTGAGTTGTGTSGTTGTTGTSGSTGTSSSARGKSASS